MSAVRRLARSAQRLLPRSDRHGVWFLAYHLVEAGTDAPVDLPRALFRRQIESVRQCAEVLPLVEAVARLGSGRLDRPAVVLTFDDAYQNFHREVWPVLNELELPATLYVPVGFVRGETPPPIAATDGMPPVTWQELAAMVDSGRLEVGSHSWSHPDLRRLPRRRIEEELRRSRGELEGRLGVAVDSFCYPRGLWSRRVERRVDAEYATAVVGGGRRVTSRSFSAIRLPRLPVRRDFPEDLGEILEQRIWLEEWAADKARRLRRG